MEIKKIAKFVLKLEKSNKIVETDATELELQDSINEFSTLVNDGEITKKLKKIVMHEIGKGKRGLSNEELSYRLERIEKFDDLNYFKEFMHDKGFLFSIIR